MSVTPIARLAHRIPEGGRIRIGTSEEATSRQGKKFDKPVKLSKFRFTSSDQAALAEIAAIYGGTVTPWAKGAAGQFVVDTDADEIKVALPPDPLGNSPIYELYEGGGKLRTCDGETCDLVVSTNDGYEIQQTKCLCDAKGEMACKVTTHLSVLLPEIKFIGVWRITSHGWNAAQELPGMVSGIRQLQERGIQRALLRVEERVQIKAGKKREFMVPVLAVDASVDALAAGMAQIGQLGSVAHVAELTTGGDGSGSVPADPVPPESDDEIIDAEIVGDGCLTDRLPQGVTTNKALVAARKVTERMGTQVPSSAADLKGITDDRIISAVLDELGVG